MREVGASGTVTVTDVASARPGATAIAAGSRTVTYGELLARADALADHLPPGRIVAVLAPRGAALVVAAMAARRAGSAYLPLDPAYPDERIAWMLADAGAAVVCTTPGLRHRILPGAPPVAVVDAEGDLVAVPEVTGDGRATHPGAAYVVYTSGSTGTPKGVEASEAGLDQLVAWHRRAFGLSSRDRTTMLASPGFDASVWEVWPTLEAGGCLVVVPDEVRADPRRLRDWLVEAGITVSFVPTVVAAALLMLPWPAETALRYLLTGGDALRAGPPEGLPFRVVNCYGVSESTVVTTSTIVTPGPGVPPIGAPIDGAVVEVVDAGLRPVPDGTPGELLIGGTGLAFGYLGNPELTAERFVTGPDGGRRYRSGDVVRRRPDGQLDHLGRVDGQLNVRGVRVEPGEVTAALDSHPAVGSSAVAVQDDGAGGRLVAWVVPASDRPVPIGELHDHLGRRLPAAMVPSLVLPVAALPTTVHGKIDRDALLAGLPVAGGHHEPVDAEAAGRPMRVTIAAVVAELLGVPSVGHDEDFFLLGGHSMLGAELLGRLEDLYGVELSLRTLFDGPTVTEIAAAVDAARSAPAPA
jgi:amino acid adenylation domain-containing protein